MKILLMGYYGQGNIGDDLFVKQLTNYFGEHKSVEKVFVMCKENYYEKSYEKNNKILYFNSQQLSKMKRGLLILNSNFIAWGGGSLDLSSQPKSLLIMQALSQLMGKSFCFLGVGLETVEPQKEKNTLELFEKSDLLYVRDKYSYKLAQEKLKSLKSCFIGGDLAFLNLDYYEQFINNKLKSDSIKNISFSGKFWWGDSRAEFYSQQLIPLIEKYNCTINLLPAHVGDERNDNKFHYLLKKYLPEEYCKLHSWNKPEEFLRILSQMDFHIGNRLHPLIFSDIFGIPSIGISNFPSKISHYIDKTEMLSMERIADFMEPLSLERIEKIFNEYQKPEEFILRESQTARECLSKLFQK